MNKKKTKVSILLGAPFTPHHFNRLGISTLSKHCDIQVLDCAYLVGRHPDAINDNKATWDNYRIIHDANELDNNLENFSPAYAIDDLGIDVDTGFIIDILKARKIKLICVKSGALPKLNLRDRIQSFIIRATEPKQQCQGTIPIEATQKSSSRAFLPRVAHIFSRVLEPILKRIRRKALPPPDYALVAGSHALDWFAKKAAHRRWIGSEDFYQFQKIKKQFELGCILKRPDRFILFIDVCLPFATDWKFLNIPAPISAEEYYPLLRKGFDHIEKLTGLPVIVAAHPGAKSILNYQALIGHRELVFGKTAELALQCSVAFTHTSTATSFAILSKKPIIFLTSHQLSGTTYGKFINAMARTLNRPLLSLEKLELTSCETLNKLPDLEKYDRYIDRYLRCHLSTEIDAWGQLLDIISGDGES